MRMIGTCDVAKYKIVFVYYCMRGLHGAWLFLQDAPARLIQKRRTMCLKSFIGWEDKIFWFCQIFQKVLTKGAVFIYNIFDLRHKITLLCVWREGSDGSLCEWCTKTTSVCLDFQGGVPECCGLISPKNVREKKSTVSVKEWALPTAEKCCIEDVRKAEQDCPIELWSWSLCRKRHGLFVFVPQHLIFMADPCEYFFVVYITALMRTDVVICAGMCAIPVTATRERSATPKDETLSDPWKSSLCQSIFAREKVRGKNGGGLCAQRFACQTFAECTPAKKTDQPVGLTVSKRIGGAVQRNRVKRIIREGLRLTQREYVLKTGFLLVIVARDAALQAKSTQIQRDLISALRRLDMLETRTENQEAQICWPNRWFFWFVVIKRLFRHSKQCLVAALHRHARNMPCKRLLSGVWFAVLLWAFGVYCDAIRFAAGDEMMCRSMWNDAHVLPNATGVKRRENVKKWRAIRTAACLYKCCTNGVCDRANCKYQFTKHHKDTKKGNKNRWTLYLILSTSRLPMSFAFSTV